MSAPRADGAAHGLRAYRTPPCCYPASHLERIEGQMVGPSWPPTRILP